MDDRSMIRPVLESLEYFSDSEVELEFYYKIIDKFCAHWFGKPVFVEDFDKVDYLLMHDLLGEYLRFESNNKRVALWLLTINRVCYNYSVNLNSVKVRLKEMETTIADDIDTSLIEPILNLLSDLESKHIRAGAEDMGHEDEVGNFLQWVGLYSSYIYSSLENKEDFYDKNVIKAMHFLLVEFIKQRSNDKRLAFLILAIIEACRQYSLQNECNIQDYIKDEDDLKEETVVAGTEENMVEELLNRLKNENQKQRERPVLSMEILADQYIKDSFDKFIEELNFDVNEAVTVFNNYTNVLADKFINFDKGQQFLFLQTLSRYRKKCKDSLKVSVHNNLKKSVEMLGEKSKIWFEAEHKKMIAEKDLYIEFIIQKLKSENLSKVNRAKLFIMLYLIHKLELLES